MQHSTYDAGSGKSPFVADVAVMVNPALSADEHTALAALIKAQGGRGNYNLGGHSKPAIKGHLKTGQR
jgi:hypothetical protein